MCFSSLWKDLPYPAHWYRATRFTSFWLQRLSGGFRGPGKFVHFHTGLPAVQLTASCISIIHYFIQNTILEFGRF